MSIILAIFPIALLILLMTKRNAMPSWKALPLVAVILWALQVFYFGKSLNLVSASVISGLLTAWTPILVIWGAIFLFHTMENTGDMAVIRKWLNELSKNKVAQLMIIGWAFAFLIEGVSGFGTPAALAAPLLVGMGFPAVRVAILTLIMNSVPVTFGAVGTPIWFGLGQLGLSESDLLLIGAKASIMHTFAALIIPLIALRFVLPWKEIRPNLGFIYLSILSCVIPYFTLAQVGYEFPAIVGGLVGLILSSIMARHGIGLKGDKRKKGVHHSLPEVLKIGFPLWGTVALLLITRIEQIGLKPFFNSALTLQWNGILGTSESWTHKLLYVPSIIPFFVISFLTFYWFRSHPSVIRMTWNESWRRIKKPIIALSGALVFVKLLMAGGDQALTIAIGQSLAELAGGSWQFFASYLGALGSFFSGSNTVSNLTFGGIQLSIAQSLNLNTTTILAAQSAGGAMGNMICINNIVAVCSVLGMESQEGAILKKTILPMLAYATVVGVVSLIL